MAYFHQWKTAAENAFKTSVTLERQNRTEIYASSQGGQEPVGT
jgi:hypothetical protein